MNTWREKSFDIVVAHYNSLDFEDILQVFPEATAFIYDKSGRHPKGTPLANCGREGYAYLTHLLNKYESLADYTLFMQDDAKSHILNYFDFSSRTISLIASGANFHQYECTWNGCGQVFKRKVTNGFCDLSTLGSVDAIGRACGKFGIKVPEEYTTETCSFFLVSKRAILSHTKEFYENLRRWVTEGQNEVVLEHMWKIIFEKA